MKIDVCFIERIREAAKEHGAVFDLLHAISNSISIDDDNNQKINAIINASNDDLEYLKSAIIAFEFAKFDSKNNYFDDENHMLTEHSK